MSRASVARADAARVPAVLVSDSTSLDILGLNARQFRDFLRAEQIPHAKAGRRTVARLDDVMGALALTGATSRPYVAPVDESAFVSLAARACGGK
jgi:hypothetical protein